MNRLLFLVIAVAVVAVAGCSEGKDYSDEGLVKPGGSEVAAGPTLTPVKSDGVGTISGTVTFDGDPPVMSQLPGVPAHADASHCLKGPVTDPTWVVDPATKGVANVVVWVTPPKGQFFKMPEQKTWKEKVDVDQPFCAFEPHVVVLYPQFFDGKEMKATDQSLVVKNSAPIAHNIRMAGSSQINPARGGNVPPKSQSVFTPRVDKQEVSLNCDIHKWMTGFAMTFDHPYAAVTDKSGKFEIKNVPAGVDLTIMAWHEARRKFEPVIDGGNKVKLDKGGTLNTSFKIAK